MKIVTRIILALLIPIFFFGCASPRITLFSDATDPLREVTLDGTAEDKVLVISISGVITDVPKSRFARKMPSVVQEVVSQLRLAEKDERIKAVLFKIDSPGGSATASDILYHEIVAFKQRSGNKVVVSMMNLATSGGYYVSLPADVIMAHPTTVTGSIGVILIRPELSGLMEKIGVDVQVNKSGENKDMGSPFRSTTPAEEKMLQRLVDSLGKRFVDLVKQHRGLDNQEMTSVAGARMFLADAALKAGLVDKIGYLQDAIDEAIAMAGIDADARIVTYRRSDFANDNIYNTLTSGTPAGPTPIVEMGPITDWLNLDSGFYYLWPQALGSR
jgi:protease-4